MIIASFRWPQALRLSLAAALAQTVEDLEVLVVEDGSDRASRRIAREARDDRVRWMCVRRGGGSQAGPNTLGLSRARAPIVAYLGHDDIWHPEHLAELLAAFTPAVDMAHAVTVWLGDDADGRLQIAGSSPWQPATFVPPSSVAHRRESPRIGAWTAPSDTGMPIDYAFLVAAHARGAGFAASGAPTVFKFPAAWRLDSYRTRDVSPQLELLRALSRDAQLGRRLVGDALAAGIEGDLAAPPAAAPGVMADYNRRFKGLGARFGPALTRWTPGTYGWFPGWHQPEHDEISSFAWTGPQERAFVRLDAPGDGELGVRIVVRHVVSPQQLDGLVVDVDGTVVQLQQTEDAQRSKVLTGWLGRAARNHTVEVGVAAVPERPSASDPRSTDERLLGAAIAEIQLLKRSS